LGFHSISFPSEWGQFTLEIDLTSYLVVSIQLVSPASGDDELEAAENERSAEEVSIQLVSPASGDDFDTGDHPAPPIALVSIQLVSPASGDAPETPQTGQIQYLFPFN